MIFWMILLFSLYHLRTFWNASWLLGLPFLGMILLTKISVLAASHRLPLFCRSTAFCIHCGVDHFTKSLFLQLHYHPIIHSIELHSSRFCHAMNLVILPLEIITICTWWVHKFKQQRFVHCVCMYLSTFFSPDFQVKARMFF